MPVHTRPTVSVLSDRDLRGQIDRAVARALVDRDYASLLLADPTLVLGDHNCPPQQYLSLHSIQANNLVEFACQARALFWIAEVSAMHSSSDPWPLNQPVRSLVAAAAD